MYKTKISILGVFIFSLAFAAIAQAVTLSDISGHQYEDAIQSLVEEGVIGGHPDGTYKPNDNLNRAEFLKIVVGASVSNVGNEKNCFPDVLTDWYAPYVCYGKMAGIVQGYPDGYFKPAQNVNYVEALKMLYLANDDEGKADPVTDEWYSKFYEDASDNGILISGVGLDQKLKRGEIAQIVWNYMVAKGLAEEDGGATDGGTTDDGTTDDGTTDDGTTDDGTTDGGAYTGSGEVGVDLDACSAMTVPGSAIYVSTTGNDGSADGSAGNPYGSVYAALESASAGGTIVIKGGTYDETEELRVDVENLTIMSYPGEWAIIDRTAETGEDVGIRFYVGSDGGKLQCVEVMGGYYAFSTETMWDWGEADRSGASDILIENVKLHDSQYDVVKIKPQSDNITLRRSEVYNSGQSADPDDCNAEGIDNVNGDNMLVQDNYIHDICSNGVYHKGGATGGIIEGNVIENTGAAGILVGFDTSPEYFDTTTNPNYYENINGIVRNNLVINTGWAGIGLYASKDAQVYNNTIINASDTYHAPIYFGITFQDWEDYAGRPANVNPTVRDNVVSQSSSLSMPLVSIRYSDELGGLSGLDGTPTMSGNCYYQEGGAGNYHDGRTQVEMGTDWYEDWEGNFTEWKAHIGADATSLETDPGLDADYIASGACAGKGYTK